MTPRAYREQMFPILGCYFSGTCSLRDAILIASALEAPLPEQCYVDLPSTADAVPEPATNQQE